MKILFHTRRIAKLNQVRSLLPDYKITQSTDIPSVTLEEGTLEEVARFRIEHILSQQEQESANDEWHMIEECSIVLAPLFVFPGRYWKSVESQVEEWAQLHQGQQCKCTIAVAIGHAKYGVHIFTGRSSGKVIYPGRGPVEKSTGYERFVETLNQRTIAEHAQVSALASFRLQAYSGLRQHFSNDCFGVYEMHLTVQVTSDWNLFLSVCNAHNVKALRIELLDPSLNIVEVQWQTAKYVTAPSLENAIAQVNALALSFEASQVHVVRTKIEAMLGNANVPRHASQNTPCSYFEFHGKFSILSDCRPTDSSLVSDCRPTDSSLVSDCRPTDSSLMSDFCPTDYLESSDRAGALKIDIRKQDSLATRPTPEQQDSLAMRPTPEQQDLLAVRPTPEDRLTPIVKKHCRKEGDYMSVCMLARVNSPALAFAFRVYGASLDMATEAFEVFLADLDTELTKKPLHEFAIYESDTKMDQAWMDAWMPLETKVRGLVWGHKARSNSVWSLK